MIRWIGFAVGILLVVTTFGSVLGTLVVPRGIGSVISRGTDLVVDLVFRSIGMPIREYRTRDRVLAWQAPVTLILRLASWLGLLYLGYALVLLPFVPGPATRAFSESGSSMFTLGYAAPLGSGMTVVDYFAAFTGLIVVGLQIGYLPTLYSAFNKRETEVTLLISRAGIPAWGPEILARTKWGIAENSDTVAVMTDLFDTWQRWAAEVAESHTTYLTLTRFRSPRAMSHWLTSLLAVMDAGALHLSIAPSARPDIEARLCVRMGFVALRQIGQAMRLHVDEDPDPDDVQLVLTKADFVEAYDMLMALGYPIERTADEAWPHFRGWRANYEPIALAMARKTDAPPALWSGPRRWPSTPIPPDRPQNRLATGAEPPKIRRPSRPL